VACEQLHVFMYGGQVLSRWPEGSDSLSPVCCAVPCCALCVGADARAALRMMKRIQDLNCPQCKVGSGGHTVG
jgi:hypothetical protein